MTNKVEVYDIEVFKSYFLTIFKNLETNEVTKFTHDKIPQLLEHASNCIRVGFNSVSYDELVLKFINDNPTCTIEQIYERSQLVISNALAPSERYSYINENVIDLFALTRTPYKSASLKKHQFRMKWKSVREYVGSFDAPVLDTDIPEIEEYCLNDVESTEALFHEIEERGLIANALGVRDTFPFLGNSTLYLTDSSIGTKVLNNLYRQKGGTKVDKPNRVYFKPSRDLPKCTFQTDVNIGVWNYLMTIPEEVVATKDKPLNKEWKEKYLKDLRLQFGNLSAPLKIGGLHSEDVPGVYEGNIIDLDVKSYYPAILEMLGKSPAGTSGAWLEAFKVPYYERIRLKDAGDKVGANSMKIVVNAVSGNLNNPYSMSYDTSLSMTMLLGGQLMLAELAERFTVAGIQVISLNTDGVTLLSKNQDDEISRISKQWQTKWSFVLEEEHYDKLVYRNINNYFAIKDGVVKKRKGEFDKLTMEYCPAIHEPVINYYLNGTPPEQSLKTINTLFDYCGLITAKEVVSATWKDTPIQCKTNRVYYSTDGAPIILTTKLGITRKATNSDGCKPANYIDDDSLPSDLDIDWYKNKALEMIEHFDTNTPFSKLKTDGLFGLATKLKDKGLYPVPKGTIGNPKKSIPGTRPTNPNETKPIDQYPWYQYNGVGIYTGKDFGVIAIDIDHLQDAVNTGVHKFFKGKSPLVSWHGNHTAKDVRDGKCRGTLVYKYNGDVLTKTGAEFLVENGFEILYGKTEVQVAGVHGSGEEYKCNISSISELPELPKPLEQFLVNCQLLTPTNSNVSLDTDQQLIDINTDFLSYLQQKYPKHNVHVEGDEIRSKCFYGHDDDNSGREMAIGFVEDDRVITNCYHTKCKDYINKVVVGEYELFNVRKPNADDELLPVEDHSNVSNAIEASLNNQYQLNKIEANTGAGKTHAIVQQLINHLANGDTVLVLVPGIEQIEITLKRLAQLLNYPLRSLPLGVATSEPISINGVEMKRIEDNDKIVISHFTYSSQKGDGTGYYALMDRLVTDGGFDYLYIDEADAYIEAQRQVYVINETRYKQISNTKVPISQCQVFTRSGNCTGCKQAKMWKYDNNYLGIPYYTQRALDCDMNAPMLEDVDIEVGDILATSPTSVCHSVEQPQKGWYHNLSTSGHNELENWQDVIKTKIAESWKPTVTATFPTIDGAEVSPEDVTSFIQSFGVNQISKLPIKERVRLSFPGAICNTQHLQLVSRAVFEYYKLHIRKIMLLSATYSNWQLDFMQDVYRDYGKHYIPTPDHLQIDKVKVIHSTRRVKLNQYRKFNNKTLWFYATKSDCEKSHLEFAQKSPDMQYLDKPSKSMRSMHSTPDDIKLTLTYAGSPYSRGGDASEHKIAVVSPSYYKPLTAYVVDDTGDVDSIRTQSVMTSVKQCVGRVLRKAQGEDYAERTILIHDCSVGELEMLVEYLEVSGKSVEVVEVPDYLKPKDLKIAIPKLVNSEHCSEIEEDYYFNKYLEAKENGKGGQWLRDNRFLIDFRLPAEQRILFEQEAEERNQSKIGVQQRKFNKAEKRVSRQLTKFLGLIEKKIEKPNKVVELLEQEKSNREIKRAVNHVRLSSDDKALVDLTLESQPSAKLTVDSVMKEFKIEVVRKVD